MDSAHNTAAFAVRPGSAPVPNVSFDSVYSQLGEAELTVLRSRLRRPVGFGTDADAIRLTQVTECTRRRRRTRARVLVGMLRMWRGRDPGDPLDLELIDAVDVECDRRSSLLAVRR